MDNPVYAMLQAEDSQRLLEGSSEGGASDETSHQKREEEYPGTVFGHGKESSIVQVDSKSEVFLDKWANLNFFLSFSNDNI